jgi:hypothetical protein
MAQKEGINVPLVVTLALSSAVFLIVVVFGVQAWFNYEVLEERDSMWATMTDKTALNARQRQEHNLDVGPLKLQRAMDQIVASGGKVPWKTNP